MYKLNQVLEDALFDWLVICVDSNVEIIWDKPDEERPRKPYCTLNIISGPVNVNTRGEYSYKELDTYEYYFNKRFTLSINIYGNEYINQQIDYILNGTMLESKLQILRAAGLSIWGVNGPNDISRPIDSGYEFRNHLDVHFSYGELVEDIPGSIETVSLNGTIIG